MVVMRLALAKAASMRRQLYFALLLALFLFSAFRFEVGCDWTGYINQYFVFRDMPLSETWSNREGLWLSLLVLQNQLNLPYPWINVVSSTIFFVGLHAMARRQPDPLAFLVLLFPILIVNMPMSGIRQGSAIGLMFTAFNAFVDRKTIRFVLLTFIAAGFHASALVFLLLAPLVAGGFSWRRLVVACILALPGAYFMVQGDTVGIATDRYVGTAVDAAGAAFRVGLVGVTAAYFLYFLRWDWLRNFPVDFKLAMVGCILMLAMIPLLLISSVIADRLAYYLFRFRPLSSHVFRFSDFREIGRLMRHFHMCCLVQRS